jgi:threonine/homoserine/homoserine lactone efflux protein
MTDVDLGLYFTFLTAAAVLLVIPGPTVLLVISHGLAGGRGAALSTVAGVALGDLTCMTLSLAGLGATLAASSTLFTLLRLAGAGYLVYLGCMLWLAPPTEARPVATPLGRGRMFRRAWLVTALNPKGITFFVAFFPQFLHTGEPLLPQMLLLGGSFLALAIANATVYALVSGHARTMATSSLLKPLRRVAGALCVGAGIWSAVRR